MSTASNVCLLYYHDTDNTQWTRIRGRCTCSWDRDGVGMVNNNHWTHRRPQH